MLDRHIFLIGMPGAGKSSLGRKVSSILRIPYVDMDKQILEEVGCDGVPEMFARYGENSFRVAETNLLLRLTGERPAVVSTGGGTVLRPENRGLMRSCGLIVLIDRPVEEIKTDIKVDRRPLLAAKGPDALDDLYRDRA